LKFWWRLFFYDSIESNLIVNNYFYMTPPNQSPLIAVVDDDMSVGISLAKLLLVLGFRTHLYLTGADFLFSLGGQQPDCILVDAGMPNTDGHQVIEYVRGMGLTIPIILATGNHDEDIWERALALGANSIMLKPYCVDDLCIKINQVLGCPGFIPSRCPWPCPAIGKGVWNCAFAGFSDESRAFLNSHQGPHSPELLSALARVETDSESSLTHGVTSICNHSIAN
jgi:CheY-like chemotaxis protein